MPDINVTFDKNCSIILHIMTNAYYITSKLYKTLLLKTTQNFTAQNFKL